MPEYYTALTIGPIYKTLANARRTRELWAASYTFSYLMKKILSKLLHDTTVARNFILPSVNISEVESNGDLGAGVFPDRIIYSSDAGGEAVKLKGFADEVVQDFAKDVADEFGWNEKSVREYFDGYFRFCFLEKELSEGENPILKLTPYLDTMELQAQYTPYHEDLLEKFFNRVNKTFLVKDGYSGGDAVSFETLVEIAAKQFSDNREYKKVRHSRIDNYYGSRQPKNDYDDKKADKDDADVITSIKKEEAFRAAHKYVAIVHSDGDNVGKIIMTLEPSQFGGFSKKLSEFSRSAVQMVDDYGGMPVYAGGDDLLFFAPVMNNKNSDTAGKNIFDLLALLDAKFKTAFSFYKTTPSPALSFGLSISYYKFPLFEALEESRRLLFAEAKTGNRNNIALRILKHSGHAFGETLHIPSDQFKCFQGMIHEHIVGTKGMLNSVVYKIHQNEKLFSLIGSDAEKVNNFIENSFNEKIHDDDEMRAFLDAVKKLIATVFADTPETDKALNQIYAMLRTISFFNEKDAR